ncbi:SDR family oxidoreductase [Leifsonia sp. WHRI 6310E]|uniref:SDR family oxidoreductase n=1 Tax=Leifsonia sp. WHRI 6310E TaxID=3162562 RepID=UPI0032EC645E
MSRVAIVGAHGKVAQQLMRVLYDQGDDFVGIVRNDDHAEDVYRLGGEGVLLDIESATADELAAAISGCDAVVFTAGAGGGSGVERKRTVDYGGSVKSAEAAVKAGVRRFVQVSAWGVDSPVAEDAEPDWRAYVDAKRDADTALRQSGLDWTILRPGALTFDDGPGLVTLGESVERGSIPREDVARLIAACLDEPGTIGKTWEAVSGDTPIAEAVRALVTPA